MLSVIGYIRVSTIKQASYGNSLGAQKKQIQAFAKANKLKIKKWFTDTDTARNEENRSERPDFKRATELATKKKWAIIVATSDRFSRTSESYDRFINADGKVYSTDVGFGADEAVMRAKIKRAKVDGDLIARRTKEGQDRVRAEGKTFGSPDLTRARAASAAARQRDARLRAGNSRRA